MSVSRTIEQEFDKDLLYLQLSDKVVQLIEQDLTNQAKKRTAFAFANQWLLDHGVQLDYQKIDDLIEKIVEKEVEK